MSYKIYKTNSIIKRILNYFTLRIVILRIIYSEKIIIFALEGHNIGGVLRTLAFKFYA